MPVARQVFDLAADDTEDGSELHDGWDDFDPIGAAPSESGWSEPRHSIQVEHEPELSTAHEAPSLSTSPAPWRCSVCDFDRYHMVGSTWTCSRCSSTDFYLATRPTKRVTSSGTWMFVPHETGGSEPLEPPAQATRRRKKKKRVTTGPPSGPPSSTAEADEWPESQTPTVDPVVEPGPVHPHPKVQPGPRLPRARPQRDHGATAPTPHDNIRNDVNTVDAFAGTSPQTAMRQTSDSSTTWNSRKGPEPGIKWKSGQYPAVPTWKYDSQDMRAFAKYKKKIAIWQLQMKAYATPKEQALLVYNSLTGEPEQELEHMAIDDFYVEDGVQRILQKLQRPLEQRVIYQKRRFLQDFEQIRRYQGETMRAYVLRFRRVQRSLTAVGVNLEATFDGEAFGSRLLDRSGLSHADQRLILVGAQQSLDFEAIAECLTLQWPEFRAPPPVVNKDGKGLGKSGKNNMSTSSSSSSTSFTSSSQTSKGSGKGIPRRQAFVANATEAPPEDDDEFLEVIDEEPEQEEEGHEGHDETADAGEADAGEADGWGEGMWPLVGGHR